MCLTEKMSDNPISAEYNYLIHVGQSLLDRFFLEMPGVTQREIVTDGLSCLSKKKNVQTGSRVIRLSSPRCNFTRVLNIKIKKQNVKATHDRLLGETGRKRLLLQYVTKT